jgi:hypothetical protein
MSAPALHTYDRVVVVIPAHSEVADPPCLRAGLTAGHPHGFAHYLTELGRSAAGDYA